MRTHSKNHPQITFIIPLPSEKVHSTKKAFRFKNLALELCRQSNAFFRSCSAILPTSLASILEILYFTKVGDLLRIVVRQNKDKIIFSIFQGTSFRTFRVPKQNPSSAHIHLSCPKGFQGITRFKHNRQLCESENHAVIENTLRYRSVLASQHEFKRVSLSQSRYKTWLSESSDFWLGPCHSQLIAIARKTFPNTGVMLLT